MFIFSPKKLFIMEQQAMVITIVLLPVSLSAHDISVTLQRINYLHNIGHVRISGVAPVNLRHPAQKVESVKSNG